MLVSRILKAGTVLAALIVVAPVANAGPFILSGTDADDHGSASGGVNLDGWLYMQRVLENLAPGISNGQTVVVSLGSDVGQHAGDAAASAFNLSSIASGRTFQTVNTAASINAFFSGTGAGTVANAAIIMLDSGVQNITGGSDSSEQAAIASNAAVINSFLGGGGALFSQANDYAWLSALLPGLTVSAESTQGISLMAAGSAAFPGLSNSDLSSGPYHLVFGGSLGGISILGTSNATSNPVIIGSSGGSITAPDAVGVPEPATLALLGSGLLGMGLARRRRAV